MLETEKQEFANFSLGEHVERYILDGLRTQRIRPGDVLPPEAVLASQLGVSRAPVREAMARLRAAGVLDTKPGRGSVILSSARNILHFGVAPPPGAFDESLFELRVLLECEAAALAAQRRTDEDLRAIEQALEAMRVAAGLGKTNAPADIAFHRAVAAATQNAYITKILEFVSDKFAAFVVQATNNSEIIGEGPGPAVREHARILAAIRRRDAEAARSAGLAHLHALKRRLSSRTGARGEE